MILGLDELTNDHMRLRIHGLNLCILNQDLVRPYILQLFKSTANVPYVIDMRLEKLEFNGLGFS